MSDTSEVEILYDGATDLTDRALITSAKFTVSSAANPGTAEIVMKDMDRDLELVTGKRLKLNVDGVALWSGFVGSIGRSSFLPAGDGLGANTISRKWVVRGRDNNILLDTRVSRRPADYLKALPNITTDIYDGAIIRQALEDYYDLPGWLDIDSGIDDVVKPREDVDVPISADVPWAHPQQGSKLRELFVSLSDVYSGAVYYIGPDDKVHYHSLQDTESPWGFSDQPNNATISGSSGFEGAYWGFRELNADEDGSGIVTDALVWGGSEFAGTGETVFARATDATLEAIHNKWQRAEMHFGERYFRQQVGVDQRANVIVFGNPAGTPGGTGAPGSVPGEGPRGLRYPQWAYTLTWFTRNVPTLAGVPRHLYPGDIVPIQLWTFSEDGGTTPFTKWLPLRSLTISFPSGAANGEAIVRFDGGFDLRNEDSKFLWKYLRRRERQTGDSSSSSTVSVVDGDSTSAPFGALGQFEPTPAPDGVTTVFTIPFGYMPGTLQVFLNGLLQNPDDSYTESDPDNGEFTMSPAPFSTDTLYVTCRTLAG